MSEQRFTKGPYYRDGQVVCTKTSSGDDAWSAYVENDFGDASAEELEATAQLFSAAPDLYEALTEALPLVEGFDDADYDREEGEEPIVAPILRKIRAALAKAAGSGSGGEQL